MELATSIITRKRHIWYEQTLPVVLVIELRVGAALSQGQGHSKVAHESSLIFGKPVREKDPKLGKK